MKLFKTNKKRFIAIILVITTLSTLFTIAGSANQMGAPSYFKNSAGTETWYTIYLWNEDPSNPTSTTPYKIHADMVLVDSTKTFAVVYASISRYNSITGTYVDVEYDAVDSSLEGNMSNNYNGEIWNYNLVDNFHTESVSNICNSSNTSVTDAFKDEETRDPGYVKACANVIVGSKYTIHNSYLPTGVKEYIKKFANGAISSTYFIVSSKQSFSRVWN